MWEVLEWIVLVALLLRVNRVKHAQTVVSVNSLDTLTADLAGVTA